MLIGMNMLYCYTDKSKFYKAWRQYYDEKGLSYTKMNKKVLERVRIGKMPLK